MVAGPLPHPGGQPHAAQDGTYGSLPLLGSQLGITILRHVKQKNLLLSCKIILHLSPVKLVGEEYPNRHTRPPAGNVNLWIHNEQNIYCVYLGGRRADLTALVFG